VAVTFPQRQWQGAERMPATPGEFVDSGGQQQQHQQQRQQWFPKSQQWWELQQFPQQQQQQPSLQHQQLPAQQQQQPPVQQYEQPPLQYPQPPEQHQQQLLQEEQPIPPEATTLVVRNLPANLSQDDLLMIWPPDGSWDYFHCPYNLLHRQALGYLFINFTSPAFASAFKARWHGRPFPGEASHKILNVVPAELQGWRALLGRVKIRKLGQFARAGHLPVLLVGGQRLGIPEIIAEAERDTDGPAGRSGESENTAELGRGGEGAAADGAAWQHDG